MGETVEEHFAEKAPAAAAELLKHLASVPPIQRGTLEESLSRQLENGELPAGRNGPKPN
jgi:hypothetical protein